MWNSYQQLACVAKQSVCWEEEKQATVSPCSQSQAVGWEADSGGHMWDDVVSVDKTISPRSIFRHIILFSCYLELFETIVLFIYAVNDNLRDREIMNTIFASLVFTQKWRRLCEKDCQLYNFQGSEFWRKREVKKGTFHPQPAYQCSEGASQKNHLHPYRIKDISLRFFVCLMALATLNNLKDP